MSGLVAGAAVMGDTRATPADRGGPGRGGRNSVRTSFVPLGDNVPGLLYEPVPQSGNARGKKSRIGLILMHPDGDFLTHDAALGMATRGYRVLTANTSKTEKGRYHLDSLLPEVESAVDYLRGLSGVETVILAGHSGGAHLFSYYQNVAENGVQACRAGDKLLPCSDEVAGLSPADGLILLDGHMGYGVKGLLEIDPAIADPWNPNGERIQEVDMYDPANGFNPNGASSYSDSFLDRFFAAQAERMTEVVGYARSRVDAIESDSGKFPDDEPFVLVGTKARAYKPDPTILSHTRDAWPLIKPDGTVEEQVIESLRGPADTDAEPPVHYLGDEVMPTTVRKLLSTNAALPSNNYEMTEDSIRGVDYSSTNANTPGNLEGVSVPLSIIAATGHYHIVQNEIFRNHAGSSDKSLVYVEGASHGFSAIAPEYGDPAERTFDYVDSWIAERFR